MTYFIIYLVTVLMSYLTFRYSHINGIIDIGIEHLIIVFIPFCNMIPVVFAVMFCFIAFIDLILEQLCNNSKRKDFVYKFFLIKKQKNEYF